MRTQFTPIQFAVILFLNITVLTLVVTHYINEKVRVVHDTQTNTVTVNKYSTVEQNDAALMDKAQSDFSEDDSTGLQTFHIDDRGNPIVTCKTQ
jgi:hypothetical protein